MRERATHCFDDGRDAPHGTPCLHLSLSGVDRAEGEAKLWRCDACGQLRRFVMVDGIAQMVRA